MSNTITDVINFCEKKYKLVVSSRNISKYTEFMERQLAEHPDYDLDVVRQRARKIEYHDKFPYLHPYFILMSDKLFLFSYLDGETPIITKFNEQLKERGIYFIEDAYLLRPTEFGATARKIADKFERRVEMALRQNDLALLSLYLSISNNYRVYREDFPFQNWSGNINELGQDIEIVNHFDGEIITYKMVLGCPSPNIGNYGGYRKSNYAPITQKELIKMIG